MSRKHEDERHQKSKVSRGVGSSRSTIPPILYLSVDPTNMVNSARLKAEQNLKTLPAETRSLGKSSAAKMALG